MLGSERKLRLLAATETEMSSVARYNKKLQVHKICYTLVHGEINASLLS